MKKLFVIMILIMSVLVVNAQRTDVKISELQKTITDNISKDYAGFSIQSAVKIVLNDSPCYEVSIVKGSARQTLQYDKDGKFIKKVVRQEGTVSKPEVRAASRSKGRKQ